MQLANSADLVWLEKEAFPWLPYPLERAFFPRNVPVVSDYDDAVFHRYDLHGNRAVRRLLGRKIDRVMTASSVVLAGNDYLEARALQAGARHVEIIPTVVDLDLYRLQHRARKRPTLGWIGTPETWTAFVQPMLPLLAAAIGRSDASFLAVGGRRPSQVPENFEFAEWSEHSEVAQIGRMDVGIMPLPDSPWAQGKCGYKLIQYMACGIPVIASPVGVNATIVEHGKNGFLAGNEDEWAEAVRTLLENPDLRRRMGMAGRMKVEREFSLQVYGPKVAALLRRVATKQADGVAPSSPCELT